MVTKEENLRVLHLASFVGNIGDIANHAGTYLMFSKELNATLEFTQLEIREFYWKQRYFNSDFIEYANSFDLLIIGGGNYFELWVEQSSTGTSIDISPELLAHLKVPTVFYALGVDRGMGYTPKSIERFSTFIHEILSRKNIFLCIRNDGSYTALCQLLGEKLASTVPVMPDGGFFVNPQSQGCDTKAPPHIGINIAGDLLETRFNKEISTSVFLNELANACIQLINRVDSLQITFMPHIWRDNVLLGELLSLIPDPYLRKQITIGQLEPRASGLKSFISNYQSCDLVLGTRFHANVCPIGMGIPTRGLLNYPQIAHLYKELNIDQRLIDIRSHGFGEQLVHHTLSDLSDLPTQREIYRKVLKDIYDQASTTLKKLNTWLMLNLEKI